MKNRTNRIIFILAIALVLSIILISLLVTSGKYSIVKDNTIYAESYSNKYTIELKKDHEKDNDRFITPAMLPGDSVSKDYDLRAYYRGNVSIHFRIHNYDGLNRLMDTYYDEDGEVIKEYGPRVMVIIGGNEYYNGFFKNLPSEFVIKRKLDKWDIETIKYQIVLSLDEGVTSDYTLDNGKFQNKEESFDMEWWIEGGTPYTPPITGINDLVNNPNTYVFLIAVIGVAFVVYFARRKKEYE